MYTHAVYTNVTTHAHAFSLSLSLPHTYMHTCTHTQILID